jgi:hypothetical protein
MAVGWRCNMLNNMLKRLVLGFALLSFIVPELASATALSANRLTRSRNKTATKVYEMTASATIYAGSLVCLAAAGTAEACAATAGFSQAVGVAQSKVVDDSTFVGKITVDEGEFLFGATSIAATDNGHVLYIVDDQTVDETATTRIAAGTLVEYVSSTSGWIRVGPTTKRNRSVVVTLPISLASIADGDVVTNYAPGFAGVIKSVSYFAAVVSSTSSKASTLNLEVNTTNVGGCTLALTTATTNELGEQVASSACTTGATFDENDTLSVEAASTTAFAEGSGYLLIAIEEVN